jgi:hypothetical protein
MDGFSMNVWYIAAIFFGAVAAFCTYYGSVVEGRRSSEEQTTRIESKLQTLGTQIQELRLGVDSPNKSAKIQEVDERYRTLAEEFFRSMPLRAAQEEVRTAKQQVDEIQRTQEIEAHFQAVKREAEKLAAAYNRSAGRVVLELQSNGVQENLFDVSQDHPAFVLLKILGQKYWVARIVTYPDRTFALQFVRLLSPDGSSNYKTMQLTNDSINFVLFKDEFGISLNQSISDSVKANITEGLSIERQPMDNFEATARDLTRRIIEYELLPLHPAK